MIPVRKFLLAGFVVATGVAFAQAAATDPDVIARQDLMKIIGGSSKTLGDMAGGKTAFDAAAAKAARDALVAASLEIEARFSKETNDPEQKAKAEVWTNRDDFLARARALTEAATALDPGSVEQIGAGMADVGPICVACHKAYRR